MLTSNAMTQQKYKRHLKGIMIVGESVSNKKKWFRVLNKGNDVSAQGWNPALSARKYTERDLSRQLNNFCYFFGLLQK